MTSAVLLAVHSRGVHNMVLSGWPDFGIDGSSKKGAAQTFLQMVQHGWYCHILFRYLEGHKRGHRVCPSMAGPLSMAILRGLTEDGIPRRGSP